MARVSLVQFDDGQARNFYNVHAAVGPGAPNGRNDVLLVQYFLREIFKGVPEFQSDPFPGGELTVDGIPSPKTFAAIRHFQKVSREKFGQGAQDGRVDPPVGEKVIGSISHAQYTILFMNIAFKKARPQDWPRVSQASDCPGELRPRLREPKFFGT